MTFNQAISNSASYFCYSPPPPSPLLAAESKAEGRGGRHRTRAVRSNSSPLMKLSSKEGMFHGRNIFMMCHVSTEKQRNIARIRAEIAKEKKELLSSIAKRNTLSRESRRWRREVLKKDNGLCVECGASDGLHAHHILPYATNVTLRFEISNGVTLCKSCHSNYHHKIKNFILSNKGWVGIVSKNVSQITPC